MEKLGDFFDIFVHSSSFAVGTLAPFPSVRIFCAYSGASVLLTYAFHVAFFGGWMALFGRLEESGRHALTCHRTKRKEEEEQSSCWWRAVCTEGSPGQEVCHNLI